MTYLDNLSIRTKVLLAAALLFVGLLIVTGLGIYGLQQQAAALEVVHHDILVHLQTLDGFALLTEQIQSDVFQISVLRSMGAPEPSQRVIETRLKTRLDDLNILYGQMLLEWDAETVEAEHLASIEGPLATFHRQASQAAQVVIEDPALGVMFVRSSTLSFETLQSALGNLQAYEQDKIAGTGEIARQRAQGTARWIATVGAMITLASIGVTGLVAQHLITRPIAAMTALMSRLAGGALDIEVAERDRQDEIGAMARAVEVFRQNAIDKARAEQALRQSESQLRAILDSTPFPVALVDDQDLKIAYWSRSALDLFGHIAPTTPQWYEIAYPDPDYRQAVIERWKPYVEQARYAGHAINAGEYRVTCEDGSVRICELYAAFVNGMLVVTFNDVTVQKQVEEELRTNERLLRTVTENFPNSYVSIVEQDLTVGFTSGQEFFRQHLDPEQYVGLGLEQVFGDKAALVKAHYTETFAGHEQTFELFVNNQDQLYRTVPLYAEDGTIPRILVVVENITERKRAEERIAGLARFPEENPNPVLRVARDGTVLYANPGSRSLLACWTTQAHEGIPEKWRTAVASALAQDTVRVIETACNGRIFSLTLAPVTSEAYVNLYALEITEQRQAEEALQHMLSQMRQRSAETEALLAGARAVLRHRDFADAARGIFDVCKRLIGASSGYVALLSSDGAENEVLFLDAGGMPCTVDPALPMPIRGLRAEAYHSRQVVFDNDFAHSEWMIFIPKGHTLLENVLFAPLVLDEQAVGLLGLANKAGGFDDNDARMASAFSGLASIALLNSRTLESLETSEGTLRAYSEQLEDRVAERTRALEQAQEQLLRQERLAVLGQLSGGIAHELRTPLGAIKNAVYLLNMVRAPGDADTQTALDVLSQQIKTAEQIISNLLDFARSREPRKRSVDLNEVVVQTLARTDIPVRVRLEQDLADLPAIPADSGQLGQVLGNLVLNAIQAMPEGGLLRLKTYVTGTGSVAVEVTDSGIGIPPENMQHLFEPLFTTKSRGIGLGLALVRMLVEAHDGSIEVASQIGKGSTFTVKVPIEEHRDHEPITS